MALVLTPICLLGAWHDVPEEAGPRGGRRAKAYFALLLVLETFMVGVFAATDVFLFYVFFEAMLIPVYFLIGRFGGARRQYAAMKFLLFSLAGGLVMLVAVIALYLQGPGGTDGFLIERLTGLSMDPTTERLLFVGFFLAFAVKAPMVPFHTWLPDAATESTAATATLLVGVLDKVGTFGMIRFCLQLFPEASAWATPVVVVLAVISVIYGALLAIGQTDMMRLISYTSVSHFGFIVLGIFAFTTVGQGGSTLYMVNHGFSTAALFLFAAMLVRRHNTNSKRIGDYGGWQRVTPALAGIFLIAGLSALALPGLSSFVSEFLVLVGSFSTQPVATVIATSGIILAALYILLMFKRVMTGPKPEELVADGVVVDEHWRRSSGGTTVRDLTTRDKLVAAPLIAALLLLGFLPNIALNVINPAVDKTLSHVQEAIPSLNPAGTVAEGSTK
jgi:NADH-quinone oxidoreductase subunit M